MRITKFKKLICWNIISIIGYCSMVVMGYFLLLVALSSSQLNMRADLNEYFLNYIFKHLVFPYISAYKFQLSIIFFLAIASIFENKYYNHKQEFGQRLFGNNETVYSVIFIIGLALNFLPLYLFTMFLLTSVMKMH